MEAALAALQRADGAFAAEVELGEREVIDHNVFVTVHVVTALAAVDGPAGAELSVLRGRALDYLAGARSSTGTSNHWPSADQPGWVPRLPDDADDTALVVRALFAHGRLDRGRAVELMMREVVPHRLPAGARRAPAWIEPGGFLTWLVAGARTNPIDAVVNANVIGALAALGVAGAPGYREACALVRAAVGFAHAAPPALRTTVAPFYPDLHELDLAIARAVGAGAAELAGLPMLAEPSSIDDQRPWIARAAYGGPRWRSRAVGLARRLAERATAGAR